MSCIYATVGVLSIVGITVVSNDDYLIVGGLGCLNNLVYALVNSLDSLLDSLVDTCMTHHVAICKVHHDEVVLVLLDSLNELVLNLEGAHLGLQVVGLYLGTCHQDALLALVGSLATTVEEEGNVSILLCLGGVQLALALACEVLAKSVGNVLLGEEDVNTGE